MMYRSWSTSTTIGTLHCCQPRGEIPVRSGLRVVELVGKPVRGLCR
jgi:hypothetical protein